MSVRAGARGWRAIATGIALAAIVIDTGCAASRRAADQDPMKCERDPKCEKKRGRMADCSLQCSDDPACVERCEQIQAPNGRLGH